MTYRIRLDTPVCVTTSATRRVPQDLHTLRSTCNQLQFFLRPAPINELMMYATVYQNLWHSICMYLDLKHFYRTFRVFWQTSFGATAICSILLATVQILVVLSWKKYILDYYQIETNYYNIGNTLNWMCMCPIIQKSYF